jgi:hypothetical protein
MAVRTKGSVDPLAKSISGEVSEGIRKRFVAVHEKKKQANKSLKQEEHMLPHMLSMSTLSKEPTTSLLRVLLTPTKKRVVLVSPGGKIASSGRLARTGETAPGFYVDGETEAPRILKRGVDENKVVHVLANPGEHYPGRVVPISRQLGLFADNNGSSPTNRT